MPYNGSGTFVSLPPPVYPPITGNVISSDYFKQTMADVFAGLTKCVTRDGQSPAQANIPMGGFRLTGLGNAASAQDAVAYSQHAVYDFFGLTRYATAAEVLALASEDRAINPFTLGNLNASSVQKGISRFATAAELQALASNVLGVTPGALATLNAATTQKGILETATAAETAGGTDVDRALTSGGFAANADLSPPNGYYTLPGGFTLLFGQETFAPVAPGGNQVASFPFALPTVFFVWAFADHLPVTTFNNGTITRVTSSTTYTVYNNGSGDMSRFYWLALAKI